MTFDSALHFVEYELQIIALSWMVVLYAIKAFQLSRLPMPWEQAPARGSKAAGIANSYAGIFMPWTRESSKNHLWRWFEFGAYHVGAAVAIFITFSLPFAPGMMTRPVSIACVVLIAPAFLVGFVKLYRRFTVPELRYVSTPDDYFSLITLHRAGG
jgi:nitrate reductase gamma subunit